VAPRPPPPLLLLLLLLRTEPGARKAVTATNANAPAAAGAPGCRPAGRPDILVTDYRMLATPAAPTYSDRLA